MPLDTYANLQASILSWLARPADPLVSPSIPDIIQLFEREATRRLKVGGAEKRVSLTALSAAVALPSDFGELRLATSGGVILTYVTPMQLPDGGGTPAHYTIIGNEMRLGPSPSGGCTVEIVYQSGVPPLSDTNTTNWLLTAHPDCYLFGSLVEAESFIGSDERIPLWAQRREAAFASIETADRKARWGGAPLSIRAEGVSGGNGTAAGDWTSAPPVPIPIMAIVAGDGLTGGGTEGIVTVALDTPVTIERGGTGAATAADALANLAGAPLASPVFTGDPQAPTPTAGDADTSIATTGFVGAALSAQALVGDVTGPTSATLVARLQGRPVAATAPTSLQVLQWSGTNWVPATIAAGGTLTGVTAGAGITVSGAAPSPTVALTVPVTVANGGTGSTTAGAALTALGAAPLASPVFTGNPTAPTPATADNDTSLATTAYVQAQGYATSASVTAGYLPLAGGTLAGTLAVGGNATAVLDITGGNYTGLHAPDNTGLIYIGTAAGGLSTILYRNNHHQFQNVGGTINWGVFDTNGLAVVGGITATSTVSAYNFQLGSSDPAVAGTIGFLNANGPSLVLSGTGASPAGQMRFVAPSGVAITMDQTGAVYFEHEIRLSSGSAITPDTDNQCYCGSPTQAWYQVNSHNYGTISDPAQKTGIAPTPAALAQVMKIQPYTYRWKTEAPDAPLHWGFMAPDVAAAMGKDFAGAMRDEESGVMSLAYNDLTVVLWRAVQELAAKVAALEAGK